MMMVMTRMLFVEVTESICQFLRYVVALLCCRCPDINEPLSQSVIIIIITTMIINFVLFINIVIMII